MDTRAAAHAAVKRAMNTNDNVPCAKRAKKDSVDIRNAKTVEICWDHITVDDESQLSQKLYQKIFLVLDTDQRAAFTVENPYEAKFVNCIDNMMATRITNDFLNNVYKVFTTNSILKYPSKKCIIRVRDLKVLDDELCQYF